MSLPSIDRSLPHRQLRKLFAVCVSWESSLPHRQLRNGIRTTRRGSLPHRQLRKPERPRPPSEKFTPHRQLRSAQCSLPHRQLRKSPAGCHCRTGSSENDDADLPSEFTAAQAAQKITIAAAGVWRFTAAQAAQKLRVPVVALFTAAQAAQKRRAAWRSAHIRVHCRTGSSESRSTARFTAAQAAQKILEWPRGFTAAQAAQKNRDIRRLSLPHRSRNRSRFTAAQAAQKSGDGRGRRSLPHRQLRNVSR